MADERVPKEWLRVAEELERSSDFFLLFLLGANDTGKSSLCRYLLARLSQQGRRVAWVDADLGQSTIGPPTTIGMKIITPLPVEHDAFYLRFVGFTSPSGHLLQTLVGVRALIDKARQKKVEGLILDTCGFVLGSQGQEFKFQMIDLVNPSHLIALERGRELEAILKNFNSRRTLVIHRLQVADLIQEKSREHRLAYRQEKFGEYFHQAQLMTFSFRGVGLHGYLPDFQNSMAWPGLLIAFNDEMNDTLALGIIRNVHLPWRELTCLTPLREKHRLRSIQFGSLYLDQSGRELFRRG